MNKKTSTSEKKLPDERYDEKLFKQAYKAALEAKEVEKRKSKRKKYLKIIYAVLGILTVSISIYLYLHFRPERFDYLESYEISIRNQVEDIPDIELSSLNSLAITAPSITAQSAIAFDPDSGSILFEKDADEKRSVASITKLVSTLVMIDTFDLEDTFTVSLKNFPENIDGVLEIEEDSTMNYIDALEAMLLISYNDVAYAVANSYPLKGYEGFLDAMNMKVKSLGMSNSSFSNPAGLDDSLNYSTARDISKLISAVVNQNEILDTVQKGYAVISWEEGGVLTSKTVYTTNKLYGVNPYVKGLKTGTTKEASECFVGYFVYPNGKRLVTVVLGSEDRFEDTRVIELKSRYVLK